jgi:hypothetical protein
MSLNVWIDRVIALMLGRLRMSIDDAISAYVDLMQKVYSEPKLVGDARSKATKLEKGMKNIIKSCVGNSDERMLDRGDEVCRT